MSGTVTTSVADADGAPTSSERTVQVASVASVAPPTRTTSASSSRPLAVDDHDSISSIESLPFFKGSAWRHRKSKIDIHF